VKSKRQQELMGEAGDQQAVAFVREQPNVDAKPALFERRRDPIETARQPAQHDLAHPQSVSRLVVERLTRGGGTESRRLSPTLSAPSRGLTTYHEKGRA
jgi:hypothetical protein